MDCYLNSMQMYVELVLFTIVKWNLPRSNIARIQEQRRFVCSSRREYECAENASISEDILSEWRLTAEMHYTNNEINYSYASLHATVTQKRVQ